MVDECSISHDKQSQLLRKHHIILFKPCYLRVSRGGHKGTDGKPGKQTRGKHPLTDLDILFIHYLFIHTAFQLYFPIFFEGKLVLTVLNHRYVTILLYHFLSDVLHLYLKLESLNKSELHYNTKCSSVLYINLLAWINSISDYNTFNISICTENRN